MPEKTTGIGVARRQTSWAVQATDVATTILITLGGIGTIVAVLGVCVFLVYVVIPLFGAADLRSVESYPVSPGEGGPRLMRVSTDEYQRLGWAYFEDSTVVVFRFDTGETLDRRRLFEGAGPSAAAFAQSGEEAVFGFPDGSMRLAKIGFEARYLESEEVPEGLRGLSTGTVENHRVGVIERTSEGQWRTLAFRAEFEEPAPISPGSAVKRIDLSIRPDGPVVCAISEDGMLRIKRISKRKNLLTGKVTTTLTGGELPSVGGPRGLPGHLLLTGVADNIYLVYDDGTLVRVDARSIDEPKVAERLDLVEEVGARVTAVGFLPGKSTLLCGDTMGRVHGWFRIKPPGIQSADGSTLVRAKPLPGSGSPVTALGGSSRSRLLAAGYEDGTVRLYHVTSERSLAQVGTEPAGRVDAIAVSPKEDGILAAGTGRLFRCNIVAPHPETTVGSILGPVWYEGYENPQTVWQSSSGDDAFEPKYGVWPLIFGTLKATFYSMLFGVPLALLAAFFTSEFLHPKLRAKVKPTIEMMASLPSVVLGFLAALVIAPFIEDVVPHVLTMFVTVPFFFILGGYGWQALPSRVRNRLARFRILWIASILPIGVGAGWLLGPAVETMLFAGDLKAWLDGQIGSGVGAWFMILLPFSAVATALMIGRWVNPRLERAVAGRSRLAIAGVEIGKFLAGTAATFALALLLGALFNAGGWDPRDAVMGTYVQRNALIVGFIMGFAVIPIIYTIAEDALSAVPEHLRSGSLALGATPWQTGARVIVPTAMSGIFSAVMVGLGRAVGETMIVLMAAGNTPVLEWNIFNGFRTLSANIAVELPEAVQNSTHYRMLFLSALTLFAMTFILNTAAETVRLRFRRRAYQL